MTRLENNHIVTWEKCYRQMLKEHKLYWEYKVGGKEATVQIFPAWWAIPSATMLNSSLITSKKP